MTKSLKQTIKEAKRRRENRAYYANYLKISNLRESGILQEVEKTRLDLVQISNGDCNEHLSFYGFNSEVHLELELSIVSLLQSNERDCDDPARWRLGSVRLLLDLGDEKGGKFVYEHEQLLDYDAKRRHPDRHENLNVYKIGSLTIETVLAFSFTRILFNGLMRVGDDQQVRPVRLAISTHPTCDKFDYKYRFDTKYTAAIIERSLKTRASTVRERNAEQLLDLVLEDRFDQPLMFQGRLESLDDDNSSEMRRLDESFVMWGAKVKLFADARNPRHEKRDCLFAWTECGHQIHLSRPGGWPNLVYGMVHNSYDYASQLLEASLWEVKEGVEKEVEFGELKSFDELKSSHVIKLKAFRTKEYKLEFIDECGREKCWKSLKVNDFAGKMVLKKVDFGGTISEKQDELFSVAVHSKLINRGLAEEKLLGGKGNSLVDLGRNLTSGIRLDRLRLGPGIQISVPRGLIITNEAFQVWLDTDPRVMKSLVKLDMVRRELAMKSAIYLNPFAVDCTSLAASQRVLQEQCERTRECLLDCKLPDRVRLRLHRDLIALFGEGPLGLGSPEISQIEPLMPFAVRSSAVGEDSLETSAAGQMRTILNVRGVEAMSKAIVECWASQFLLEAVTYKSQNGLDFYLPMAVVVQELVECQVAGVAATCNPMTGNKRQLEIVGNLGLGENVVAGRQADTVRISSDRLDNHAEKLSSWRPEDGEIEKLTATGKVEDCCLSDEQIEALANLLLEIRRTSELQDREVEWGITSGRQQSSASSSSSSSSSSGDERQSPFQIHLFQSRPLTNLQRLSTDEIAHELDYGEQSELDLCSRANLGEVMPGFMCAINQSWFMPLACSHLLPRPDVKDFTRNHNSMSWFGSYAHMALSVQTNSITVKHAYDDDNEQRELSQAIDYAMIGTVFANSSAAAGEQFRKFCKERAHPGLTQQLKPGLGIILTIDMGLYQTLLALSKRSSSTTKLHEDMPSLEEVRRKMEEAMLNEGEKMHGVNFMFEQINQLFDRLVTRTQPLTKAWICHILASVTSVGFNAMSLKMLSDQPAYEGKKLSDNELLNDWTILVRGDKEQNPSQGYLTESGDISKLLDRLLEGFVAANQIDQLKQMEHADLYKSLCANQLFVDFMTRNGHRAWKEFCLSTKTWRDDPSYIVRLLAARLKSYSADEAQRERDRKQNADLQHEKRLAEVLAKLTSNKWLLLNYALPRARSATIRRESSKSMLIKTIDKYRQAFRHLAGLMCLVGLLPSAELIFFLTIEELAEIVRKCCAERPEARQPRESVMPRLLYKARRRQQHCRQSDRVTFPKPTLTVREMFEAIREQMRDRINVGADGVSSGGPALKGGSTAEVRGIISCAGCVTGRACVISSLDEVDQLQENDILVTYSIDISWSVYFFMLSGIVTELGGIVSHGAVVAREYGLPTLCTAVGACSRFETGQMITLDANRGVCYVASNVESTI